MKAIQLSLSSQRPNPIPNFTNRSHGGRQADFFFLIKCSIHMSSATNSHNYLNESWTWRVPVLISVHGPVSWPACVSCWNPWECDCVFHIITHLLHNFIVTRESFIVLCCPSRHQAQTVFSPSLMNTATWSVAEVCCNKTRRNFGMLTISTENDVHMKEEMSNSQKQDNDIDLSSCAHYWRM